MADQTSYNIDDQPLSPPPNLLETAPPAQDFSKNTILVLLVLTIFVSAFGTWIVLNATSNTSYQQQPVFGESVSPPVGEARVAITDRATVEKSYASRGAEPSSAVGMAVVKIQS